MFIDITVHPEDEKLYHSLNLKLGRYFTDYFSSNIATEAGELVLWSTGGPSTWAWDRKTVTLKQGENSVQLRPSSAALIDHLNVLYAGSTRGR